MASKVLLTWSPRGIIMRKHLLVCSFVLALFALSANGVSAAKEKVVAPSNLVPVPLSNTQINVTWTDNSDNETGFVVEGSLDGNFFYSVGNVAANTTSLVDEGLSPGTTYYYRVRAYEDAGGTITYSKYSSTESAVTAGQTLEKPNAPSGLNVSATAFDSISLTWSDNANNEDGFLIERSLDGNNFSEVASLAADTVSYSDSGLSPKTTYYYRVRAYREDGLYTVYSDYSNRDKTATPSSPLSSPSSLSVNAASYSQIDLSWSDNSSDESGFLIERSLNGFTFSQVAQVAADATTYSNTGLVADKVYYYRVRAYREDASSTVYSAYTKIVSDTTLSYPLNAPSALSLTPVSYSEIDLSWSDNSSNETGFAIERSLNNVDFSQIAQVASDVVTYQDESLVPDTAYYYRVRAYSVVGGVFYFSTFTESSVASTEASPLVAPSSLVAVASSSSAIELSWSDNAVDELGYYLERSLNGTSFSRIADLGADSVSYVDSGLDSGTIYYYRVMAYKEDGGEEVLSSYSNTANASTISVTVATPSLLAASAASYSEIDLSWQDNATNETGFSIERSINGVNFSIIASVGPDATSYQDQGLVSNTNYYYRIRAKKEESGQTIYSSYTSIVSTSTEAWAGLVAPSVLTVSNVSYYDLDLSWSDNSSNEAGFDIERSSDGTHFFKIAEVGADVSTYFVSGLSGGSTYYFRVKAKSTGGSEIFYSAYSNIANATTLVAPYIAAPSDLWSVTQPWYQIDIYWTDNANNETGYWVEKSFDGSEFFPITFVGENGFMISDSDLEPSQTYYYRVRALMMVDGVPFYSDYSESISATNVDAPPTTAPSDLAASSSAGSVNLSWVDTSSDEVHFYVERSDNGSSFYEIARLSPNTTNYSDQSVEIGTEYSYRVRNAVEGNGGYYFYSDYSNIATVIAQ